MASREGHQHISLPAARTIVRCVRLENITDDALAAVNSFLDELLVLLVDAVTRRKRRLVVSTVRAAVHALLPVGTIASDCIVLADHIQQRTGAERGWPDRNEATVATAIQDRLRTLVLQQQTDDPSEADAISNSTARYVASVIEYIGRLLLASCAESTHAMARDTVLQEDVNRALHCDMQIKGLLDRMQLRDHSYSPLSSAPSAVLETPPPSASINMPAHTSSASSSVTSLASSVRVRTGTAQLNSPQLPPRSASREPPIPRVITPTPNSAPLVPTVRLDTPPLVHGGSPNGVPVERARRSTDSGRHNVSQYDMGRLRKFSVDTVPGSPEPGLIMSPSITPVTPTLPPNSPSQMSAGGTLGKLFRQFRGKRHEEDEPSPHQSPDMVGRQLSNASVSSLATDGAHGGGSRRPKHVPIQTPLLQDTAAPIAPQAQQPSATARSSSELSNSTRTRRRTLDLSLRLSKSQGDLRRKNHLDASLGGDMPISPSLASPRDKMQEFEDLINSGETKKMSLTPERMRTIESSIDRKPQPRDAARALKKLFSSDSSGKSRPISLALRRRGSSKSQPASPTKMDMDIPPPPMPPVEVDVHAAKANGSSTAPAGASGHMRTLSSPAARVKPSLQSHQRPQLPSSSTHLSATFSANGFPPSMPSRSRPNKMRTAKPMSLLEEDLNEDAQSVASREDREEARRDASAVMNPVSQLDLSTGARSVDKQFSASIYEHRRDSSASQTQSPVAHSADPTFPAEMSGSQSKRHPRAPHARHSLGVGQRDPPADILRSRSTEPALHGRSGRDSPRTFIPGTAAGAHTIRSLPEQEEQGVRGRRQDVRMSRSSATDSNHSPASSTRTSLSHRSSRSNPDSRGRHANSPALVMSTTSADYVASSTTAAASEEVYVSLPTPQPHSQPLSPPPALPPPSLPRQPLVATSQPQPQPQAPQASPPVMLGSLESNLDGMSFLSHSSYATAYEDQSLSWRPSMTTDYTESTQYTNGIMAETSAMDTTENTGSEQDITYCAEPLSAEVQDAILGVATHVDIDDSVLTSASDSRTSINVSQDVSADASTDAIAVATVVPVSATHAHTVVNGSVLNDALSVYSTREEASTRHRRYSSDCLPPSFFLGEEEPICSSSSSMIDTMDHDDQSDADEEDIAAINSRMQQTFSMATSTPPKDVNYPEVPPPPTRRAPPPPIAMPLVPASGSIVTRPSAMKKRDTMTAFESTSVVTVARDCCTLRRAYSFGSLALGQPRPQREYMHVDMAIWKLPDPLSPEQSATTSPCLENRSILSTMLSGEGRVSPSAASSIASPVETMTRHAEHTQQVIAALRAEVTQLKQQLESERSARREMEELVTCLERIRHDEIFGARSSHHATAAHTLPHVPTAGKHQRQSLSEAATASLT
ncbi:hypothetical protein THASP1DRAFT_22645 [Thamnocephalis sphaerospora]|uniref:Uncharacterized protein n=1 Tax=Thamnocephalis sphaerospora TaxID=78915 RepID=A0A4P9XTP4_9FUNG|nr:hypothetical protein THASP1DRAFT_22645 [Thamnocephalis sphaerospora]|eukprot:RKP09526.1 hypothetical protein THASP1DRAFT_22645 [Thamnocephalis sphaerospora]